MIVEESHKMQMRDLKDKVHKRYKICIDLIQRKICPLY